MAPLIAPDANLLIYAYDDKSQDFLASRAWWELSLTSAQVGLPLQSVFAFIRITTNVKFPGARFTAAEAISIVDSWLARPNVELLIPGPSHWAIFRRISLEVDARANLSTDAHLAALSIEHDATLYSNDQDFARFPGLRWINPLTDHV